MRTSTARPSSFARLLLACVLALSAVGLAACAGPGTSGTNDAGPAAGESMSTAMVVTFGDGQVLFVDQDTQSPYYPTLPEGQVYDADGNVIPAGDLSSGNIVRVTGNGIMLESYPGQYPGIAKVEVTSVGSPSDADKYDELVSQIWVEPDPNEPPVASLEYTTDLAAVSMSLLENGYTWEVAEEDGSTRTVSVDTASPDQIALADLPDACLREPKAVEARVSFSVDADEVEIVRYLEDDLSVEPEPVPCTMADGGAELTVEPGWRYAVTGQFERGEARFVFTVRIVA